MSKQDNWDAKHPPHTETANRAAQFTEYLLGSKFADINYDVMRAFSLYNFLVKHRNTPANVLQQKITENGRPIFTTADVESMKRTIRSHMNYPYVKQLISTKGGAVPTAAAAVPAVKSNALDTDPSRSKFWDRIIRKIMHPIAKRIPPKYDGLLWYTFILYSLEQNELFGPFLSTALDTITLSLPVVADLVSDTASQLMSLAPVPYAGQAGDIIGYAISLIFILFAIMLNMSRKHFGSAFKASLEAIPLIGDVAAEGAQSFEIGAERYLQNRKRMLKTIDTVSPTAEDIADYYTPSDKIEVGPAPSMNPEIIIPKIKQEIIEYGMKASGLNNIINQIPTELPNIESLEKMAAAKATSAVTKKIATASNAVAGTASAALRTVTPKKGGTRKNRCLRKRKTLHRRR